MRTKLFRKLKPNLSLLCLLVFYLSISNLNGQSNSCIIEGPIEVCPGISIYTLDYDLASGDYTKWMTTEGNIISSTNVSAEISFIDAGSSTVFVEVFNEQAQLVAGCFLHVMVYEPPYFRHVENLDGGIFFSCVGVSNSFDPNSPCPDCSYTWTVNGVDAEITSPTTLATEIVFNEAGSGEICIEVVEPILGCESYFCQDAVIIELGEPSFDVVQANNNNSFYSVCSNQDLFFINTSELIQGVGFEWTISSGNEEWNSFERNQMNFAFPSAGTYTVSLTAEYSTGVCQSTVSETFIVQDLPAIPISCPSLVCEGEEVVYSVDVTCGSYSWEVSEQGEILEDNGNSITVQWSSMNEYQIGYIIFDGNGCGGNYCTAPTVESVPIFPNAAEIVASDFRCLGVNNNFLNQGFSFPSFPGAEYEWSFEILSQNGGTVQDNGLSTPNLLSLKFTEFSGKVRVHGSVKNPVNGCSFEDTHDIEIANAKLIEPNRFCFGEEHTLVMDPPHIGQINWIVYDGIDVIYEELGGNEITLAADLFDRSGSHRVEVVLIGSMGGECSNSYWIQANQLPIIPSISGPTEICLNTPYVYQAQGQFGSDVFFWTIEEDGVQTELSNNSGTIEVTWTNPNGQHFVHVRRENPLYGDCGSATTTLAVSIIENDPLIIEGNQMPCPDGVDSYTASISGASNYTWSIPSGLGSVLPGSGTNEVNIQWTYVDEPTTVDIILSATVCGNVETASYSVTLTPFDLVLNISDLCANTISNFSSNVMNAASFQWYIDNVAVPGPQGTNAILNVEIPTAGYRCIRLEVVDPDGCPGQFGRVEEILVHDNPVPVISQTVDLPCPKGTPFDGELIATPNSTDYTYTWYLNNNVILGENGATLPIDENSLGTYYVEIENIVNQEISCVNISLPIFIDYECIEVTECCDRPPFELDVVEGVQECGVINFSGTISIFENAEDPRWHIVKPGQIEDWIDIEDIGDLTQTGYVVDQPGIYYVYLEANYLCPDPCFVREFIRIDIPFIPNFITDYHCNLGTNNTYNIIANDMSLYFEEADNVNLTWSHSGPSSGTGTGNSYSINNLAPETTVEICLQMDSGSSSYSCTICETITTPANPESSFIYDQMGLCTDQIISFYPNFNEDEVLESVWNFGDGSISQLYEVSKVYSTPGTYFVTLNLTTIYGCEVAISENITVIGNSLSGQLNKVMLDCESTAEINYQPITGGQPETYLWLPGGETTSSITVMESGVYNVIVSNEQGCTFSPSPLPVILLDPFPGGILVDFINCHIINLGVNNVNGYTYSWDIFPDPQMASPITGTDFYLGNMPSGTYTITASAIGANNVVCATLQKEVTITGKPEEPIIEATSLDCNPGYTELTVLNYDEVRWSGPSIPGLVDSKSIIVSSSGLFEATVFTDIGCFAKTTIEITDIINFSNFLTGCYEYCIDDLLNNPPTLTGISGEFVEWEWKYTDLNGNVEVLLFGNGEVEDLTLDSEIRSGSITLWVRTDECSAESDDFSFIVEEVCEEPCEQLTGEAEIVYASCLLHAGGTHVYDIVLPGFPDVPIDQITTNPPNGLYDGDDGELHFTGQTEFSDFCFDIYIDEDCSQTHCFDLPNCPETACTCLFYFPTEVCYVEGDELQISMDVAYLFIDDPATYIYIVNQENANENETWMFGPGGINNQQDVEVYFYGTDVDGDGLITFDIQILDDQGKVICEDVKQFGIDHICENIGIITSNIAVSPFNGGGDNRSELGITRNLNKDYLIYPVPSSDFVHVTNPIAQFLGVELFDLNGRSVSEFVSTTSTSIAISVKDLPTGVYVLKMTDVNGNIVDQEMVPIIH